MKKQFINTLVIAAVVITGFSACKKDDPIAVEPINTIDENNLGSPIIGGVTACNFVMNPINPAPGNYTLAMSSGNTFRRFGIENGAIGILNFTNIDKVTFEFSGLYADRAHTAKLYYIRRDTTYLTFQLGLMYQPKRQGADANLQQWLISSLGNNKYNLVLYNFGPCYWAGTWYDNGIYRFMAASPQHTSTLPQGSSAIYILSVATVPPNTN